ncbi:MAG TPA: dihydrofolate reductase family protein [Candidatus Acidoferrales bacterium]|nr:dihydrofolate reductase family protein [Candidatus Acidoferrales bacterium]
MRKIIVYIATSADGFIARPDGDVGWLDRPRVAGSYGMNEFFRSIDTVLMGRKTYEIGLKLGQTSYPGKRNFIFSRTLRQSAGADVEFIAEDAGDFVQKMRATPGKNIWLVGGSELIAALLDFGQVDEFIIHVIPTLIGAGIPLIEPRHRSVPLALLSARSFADGVVRLHYRVERRTGGESPGGKRPRRQGS